MYDYWNIGFSMLLLIIIAAALIFQQYTGTLWIGFLVLFFTFLMIGGCASESYWVKKYNEPIQELPSVYHETLDHFLAACQTTTVNALACTISIVSSTSNTVFHVQSHFAPGVRDECVERHEKAHRKGWTHDKRPVFRLDCGPPEMEK